MRKGCGMFTVPMYLMAKNMIITDKMLHLAISYLLTENVKDLERQEP